MNRMCDNRQWLLSRRDVLQKASCGFGYLAFSAIAAAARPAAASPAAAATAAAPRPGFGSAKRVIFLCMRGGPSHVDMFDYKPALAKDDGKPGPRGNSAWMKSPWKFSQHGQSGLWFSELLPGVARHADKLCMIHSMQTEVPAHPQAMVRLHTGTSQFVRPSLGAWTLYGLGIENENLPGFISISPQGGGAQNYGNAFLPAKYQGMRLGNNRLSAVDTRVPNLTPAVGPKRQRLELDFIQQMNRQRRDRTAQTADIDGVIESYETAFRMQSDMPGLLNIAAEDERTREMYGMSDPEAANFGSKCLLARRLVEAGVRFVEITHGNWDHHNSLGTALPRSCRQIDKGIDGLLTDLHERGLLDETLVIWTGEFGRTPYAQQGDGRDHNNKAFTLWMAGGGVRAGTRYGDSGEHGHEAVVDAVPIVDLHATILALLGMDHEQLTYPYAGRDFRLTDTAGRVVTGVMGV